MGDWQLAIVNCHQKGGRPQKLKERKMRASDYYGDHLYEEHDPTATDHITALMRELGDSLTGVNPTPEEMLEKARMEKSSQSPLELSESVIRTVDELLEGKSHSRLDGARHNSLSEACRADAQSDSSTADRTRSRYTLVPRLVSQGERTFLRYLRKPALWILRKQLG